MTEFRKCKNNNCESLSLHGSKMRNMCEPCWVAAVENDGRIMRETTNNIPTRAESNNEQGE